MTYENAIEKIHSLLTLGSRPGLERMTALLNRLGNPQDKLKFIHVAGTNGKGSVCAVLSSVLTAAGYKTGLFISPYITDFRERIQINNQMISKETLTAAVENTFPVLEQLRNEGVIITEFEYVNALEFYIHAQEHCDIVVLETGMGGLLDCTNVIKPPLCSVITTIGLDHTAVLGGTIAEIAEQKCGIIKSGSAAVTSRQCAEAMQVIEATCAQRRVPLIKGESLGIKPLEMTLAGSRFALDGREYWLSLPGAHQLDNAASALSALFFLRNKKQLRFTDTDVGNGLKNAVNPARLELLSNSPIVLLDGAHNPNGIEALDNAIKRFLSGTKITCVMGMLADKDIDGSIQLLGGMFERVYTVPVNNPRALDEAELAEKFKAVTNDVTAFASTQAAIDQAITVAAKENGAVLICGSLYLAGEIRPYVLEKFRRTTE